MSVNDRPQSGPSTSLNGCEPGGTIPDIASNNTQVEQPNGYMAAPLLSPGGEAAAGVLGEQCAGDGCAASGGRRDRRLGGGPGDSRGLAAPLPGPGGRTHPVAPAVNRDRMPAAPGPPGRP